MATDPRLERLVQAYLDGVATPAETADLADFLVRDPAAADVFARAVRFEDLLHSHLVEERRAREWVLEGEASLEEEASPPDLAATARRRRWPTVAAALAVAAMLLIAVRWWGGEPRAQALVHHVTAGRVLVDGIEAKSFVDGSRLEVLGSSNAVFRLADGTDFELTPAASAEIRREAGEAIVKLDFGNGKFHVNAAKRPLRVDTPLGAVSGRGADFAVDLQPSDPDPAAAVGPDTADDEPQSTPKFDAGLPAFLIVAVLAGQVEVQEADRKIKVSAGESRAFTQEKAPAFAGKVVDMSADGKRITLEGKRPKPGAPPPRREVSVTAATKSTYYGAALGDDRPTVGAWALATLDPSSPETVVAIEFGNRSPTFAGTVREVSADGRTVKVEEYRKGEQPRERTIRLEERTRLTFSGFDSRDLAATIGYQAWVWLPEDSDRASEVRFLLKTKGPAAKSTGDDAKIPPKKKPDPKSIKSGTKSEQPTESKSSAKSETKPATKSAGKATVKSATKSDL